MPVWQLLFATFCLVFIPQTPAPSLIVVDASGKEQTLKTYRVTVGTRPITWLATPTMPAPQALEFRDEDSTTFVDGVITLLNLDGIHSLNYDSEKETVTARLAGDKGEPGESLVGSTRFKGINKLTLEAEVDKGTLGIAEIKFLGGAPRGVKAIRFPAPKAAPVPTGRLAGVTVSDKGKKTVQKVFDLQPLYRTADGGERLIGLLMFKKTLKLDLAKIKKLAVAEGRDADGTEWHVTLADGEESTLTLLKSPNHEGAPLTLVGFVGKVRGGYKLFPPHTLSDIQFDEIKADAKP